MTDPAHTHDQPSTPDEREPMNTPHNTPDNNLNTGPVPGTELAERRPDGSLYYLRQDSAATAEELPRPRNDEGEPKIYEDEIIDDDPDTELVPVDPPESAVPATATRMDRREVIPAWMRSSAEFGARAKWAAAYAAHTSAYHAVRTPVYTAKIAAHAPRGAGRVLATSARWIWDAEGRPLRADAVTTHDPAQYMKLVELRNERVRKRLTVAMLAILALAAAVVVLVFNDWPLIRWGAIAAAVALLGFAGRVPDKPVAGRAVVNQKVAKLTSDAVIDALGSLGISQINQALAKGRGIAFPAPITREGPGWRADVDLPLGVTVGDIMERRKALASGLRRPLGCVWPEPDPGEHEGRLVLWVGDEDLSKAKPKPWPLAKHGTADLFREVPFGFDQRGRLVPVLLMYANVLIGAMPGAGKTFALRVLVLAAALDASAQLRLFELKGSGDLSAFEPVAHHYGSGPDDGTIEACVQSLREVHRELERRAKTIAELPRDLCPENKVTPELAVRRSLGLHPLLIAIDECQELFSHDTYGKEAGELCTAIIKRGRALGVILILATQRPDKDSLPTGVSANVGIRFCLRVMGHTENDMVLGTSMHKNGVRATTFTAKDKGIGWLVGAADDPQIARSAYIDNPAAEKIVKRARSLREQLGTITGHAAGETTDADQRATVLLIADVAAVLQRGEAKVWSETIVDRLGELRREVYGEWAALDPRAKANALAGALKPFGIDTQQVYGKTPDGRPANRRGVLAEDVYTAANNLRRATRGHTA